MTDSEIILALYSANESLMRCCAAFEANGDASGAQSCRIAACEIVEAIGRVAKRRAEEMAVSP